MGRRPRIAWEMHLLGMGACAFVALKAYPGNILVIVAGVLGWLILAYRFVFVLKK